MTSISKVNRRDFFKTTTAGAAGLMLAFNWPEKNQLQAQFPPPPAYQPPPPQAARSEARLTNVVKRA